MRHSSGPVFMRPGDRPAFADFRANVGHSLTPDAGDVARDLRGGIHEEVPEGMRRLLDCGALESDGLKKRMSTPKMKALLASDTMGIKRLRQAVDFQPRKTRVAK